MSYPKLTVNPDIPLGLSGPLVCKSPVLLYSSLILLPIKFTFPLNDNYKLSEDFAHKIVINKLFFNSHSEFFFDGFYIKKIFFTSKNPKLKATYNKVLKIPIRYKFKIPCAKFPYNITLCSSKKNDFIVEVCDINLTAPSIKSINGTCTNSSLMSANLFIYKNFNVFIPEPEGLVVLLENDSPYLKYKYDTNKDNYLVGSNPDIGLIARKLD